jgi:hypothetical protein
VVVSSGMKVSTMSPNPLILVCVPLYPSPEAVLPYFKARLAGKKLPPHAPNADDLAVEADDVPFEVKYYPTANEEGRGPSEEEWKRCAVLVCLQIPERLYVCLVRCALELTLV